MPWDMRGMMAKKQIKRHKGKRAALKTPKAIARALAPKYLRDPKSAPVLVTAYWARKDIRAEKLRLDPALALLAPRLEALVVQAKGTAFDRAINQIAKLYDMEVRRRKGDQEYVVETMKCQVQKDLADAQLAVLNPAPRGDDSHPGDYGGEEKDEG